MRLSKGILLVGFVLIGTIAGVAVYPFGKDSIAIQKITRLEDFRPFLEFLPPEAWAVKPGEYQMVCLTHQYGFALTQAQNILAEQGQIFNSKVWAAAGSFSDYPETEFDAAVVFISDEKALILAVDKRNGISVGQRSCAKADSARIGFRQYGEHYELWLR